MRRQHNHQPNKERRNNFNQFNRSKNRFGNKPNKLKNNKENNKEIEEEKE